MPPTVHTTQIKGVIDMFTKSIRSTVLAAVAFAMVPATALAIPNNGGNGEPPEPIDHAPVAKFTMSPNPALAGAQIVIQQRTRAIPADVNRFGDGDLVTFNAAASTDDFGIVKYEWDLDGNGTYEVSGDAAKKTVSRRYLQTGTFHIHLRVIDGGGHGNIATHDLIVHRAPKPVLTADRTAALVGQQVNYSGAQSTDDNGPIANYAWDLDGDGTFETNTGTTPTTAKSYDTIGPRTVKLQVTDQYGAKSVTSMTETIHRAPTAAFTANPNPATTGEQVTLDGSSSNDDDPLAKYEWDLDGNGTFETDTATTPTAKTTFTTPGTKTIRLRVTDSHGVQDVVAHDVVVNNKPTTTTTTTQTDTTAPLMTIAPRSAKMSKLGKVTLRLVCPADEATCTGRVDLRSLRGARSAAIGGKKF